MESSSVFTAPLTIQARGWGLPFVNASCSVPEAGSGWNLSPGTVQRFYLPYRQEAAEEASPNSGPTILLVEDSPADAGLVREALEEYEVRCELIVISDGESATDYIDAIDRENGTCPDLIILDLNLPKVPGRDVLRHMRASERCRDTLVAVLTSSDNQKDREEAARLGASVYLRKPSRLADFLKLGGVFSDMMGIRRH